MEMPPSIESLLKNLQPHNEAELSGNPTAPTRPSYLGGARSYRGGRALSDTTDDLSLAYEPGNGLWTHILPWSVIYPGKNHRSSNTIVRVESVRLGFLQHVSDVWAVLDFSSLTENLIVQGFELPYICDEKKTLVNVGGNKFKIQTNPIHFWKNGKIQMPFSPTEIRGVYVGWKAALDLEDENGIDDRDQSELYMNSAWDFYPDGETIIAGALPMGASSRFMKIEKYVRKYQAMNLESVGQIYRNSSYKGSVSMSLRELLLTNYDLFYY